MLFVMSRALDFCLRCMRRSGHSDVSVCAGNGRSVAYPSAKIIKKHKFVLLIYVYLLLFILKIVIFVKSN